MTSLAEDAELTLERAMVEENNQEAEKIEIAALLKATVSIAYSFERLATSSEQIAEAFNEVRKANGSSSEETF